MIGLALLLLTTPPHAAEPDAHEKINPLYRQLRQEGVSITGKVLTPLPAPLMTDGLDGKAQQTVIKKLLGDDIDLGEFQRRSVTAPQLLLPLRDLKKGDPKAPARALDLYFIAYGDFKTLANKEFLERLAKGEKKQGEGKTLTAEDLKKRAIVIPESAAKHEGYGWGTYNLLDKVEIRGTGHSYWSQTTDSLVQAAELDEHFARDAEFPGEWRPLEKTGEGQFKVGSPHPYHGAGYYVKITRLKQPAGALFVEAHLVFTEPVKWFNGENLLRSKLPPVATSMVRNLRRELLKARKGE